MEPYIDLAYVLPQLSKEYRLFTLTDELSEIQGEKLKRLGLERYFVKSISSE